MRRGKKFVVVILRKIKIISRRKRKNKEESIERTRDNKAVKYNIYIYSRMS